MAKVRLYGDTLLPFVERNKYIVVALDYEDETENTTEEIMYVFSGQLEHYYVWSQIIAKNMKLVSAGQLIDMNDGFEPPTQQSISCCGSSLTLRRSSRGKIDTDLLRSEPLESFCVMRRN